MSSGTADALGLSRAILCNGKILILTFFSNIMLNVSSLAFQTSKVTFYVFYKIDGLIKKLEELQQNAVLYKGKNRVE